MLEQQNLIPVKAALGGECNKKAVVLCSEVLLV